MVHPTPLRPVVRSSLILLTFLGTAWFSGDLLTNLSEQAISQSQKVLFYSLQCAIWFSGAYFVNTIINAIFWDRLFARMFNTSQVPRLLKNVTGIFVFAIAVTGIVGVVFQKSITGIWATSGVVGIVLGLALQSMIRDIFVGLAVNIDKPYAIGDFITVHPPALIKGAGVRGVVKEINWRTTKLYTPENSTLYIPNSVIGASVLTNHSVPESASEFDISITLSFNTDTQRARRILLAAALAVTSDKGPVLRKPAPKVRLVSATPEGIEYRIVFMAARGPGPAKDAILASVLHHMHQAGLSPSYPQRDLYLARMPQRAMEGSSVADRVCLLRRMDIFSPLTEDELLFLVETAIRRDIPHNEPVFTSGTECPDQNYSMFVLVEGLLQVAIEQEDQLKPVGQIVPGEFFGEMSLLTGVPRSATITAVTDTVMYEITQKAMAELLQRRPELMTRLSEMMAERKLRNERAGESVSIAAQDAARASLTDQLFSSMKNMFGRIWSQPH